jgi:hypothetical protein
VTHSLVIPRLPVLRHSANPTLGGAGAPGGTTAISGNGGSATSVLRNATGGTGGSGGGGDSAPAPGTGNATIANPPPERQNRLGIGLASPHPRLTPPKHATTTAAVGDGHRNCPEVKAAS